MKCIVYRSATQRNTCLILPMNQDPDSIPDEAVQALHPLQRFKEIELEPTRPIVGLDASAAAHAIRKKGYHVQRVEVSDSERRITMEHFQTEPGLERIAVYSEENEPEIRLLEVNADTIPTGAVDAFHFFPPEETGKTIRIADITPEEWLKIGKGEIPLPEGWPADTLKVIEKVEAS